MARGALRSHLGLPTLTLFIQAIAALAGSDIREMGAPSSTWRRGREDLDVGRRERRLGEGHCQRERIGGEGSVAETTRSQPDHDSPASWFSRS